MGVASDDTVHMEFTMPHDALSRAPAAGGNLTEAFNAATRSLNLAELWSTNPLLSLGVILPLNHSPVASGIVVEGDEPPEKSRDLKCFILVLEPQQQSCL